MTDCAPCGHCEALVPEGEARTCLIEGHGLLCPACARTDLLDEMHGDGTRTSLCRQAAVVLGLPEPEGLPTAA